MDAVERGEFTSSAAVVVVTTTDSFVARGGEAGVVTMDAFLVAHNWSRSARDREAMLTSSGFVRDVFTIFSWKVREVVSMEVSLFERLLWSEDEPSEVERMTGGD